MTPPTFSLGFSPCPNDTFIFYDLIYNQPQWHFNAVIEDVERLNRLALQGHLDFTKVSIATYPLIEDHYTLLDSGAALGFNCGPLLITRPGNDVSDWKRCTVAIPGAHTTANYLLSRALPMATRKQEMLFSTIEEAVLRGDVDAGVIIHESRFTYASKGLVKVLDLGEWWYENTQLPIPLGAIVAKRSLDESIIRDFENALAESVRVAMDDPGQPMDFVKSHSQELTDDVIQQHIALYVNDFSISMGTEGRQAVAALLEANTRIA